jgi:hypothetical protein
MLAPKHTVDKIRDAMASASAPGKEAMVDPTNLMMDAFGAMADKYAPNGDGPSRDTDRWEKEEERTEQSHFEEMKMEQAKAQVRNIIGEMTGTPGMATVMDEAELRRRAQMEQEELDRARHPEKARKARIASFFHHHFLSTVMDQLHFWRGQRFTNDRTKLAFPEWNHYYKLYKLAVDEKKGGDPADEHIMRPLAKFITKHRRQIAKNTEELGKLIMSSTHPFVKKLQLAKLWASLDKQKGGRKINYKDQIWVALQRCKQFAVIWHHLFSDPQLREVAEIVEDLILATGIIPENVGDGKKPIRTSRQIWIETLGQFGGTPQKAAKLKTLYQRFMNGKNKNQMPILRLVRLVKHLFPRQDNSVVDDSDDDISDDEDEEEEETTSLALAPPLAPAAPRAPIVVVPPTINTSGSSSSIKAGGGASSTIKADSLPMPIPNPPNKKTPMTPAEIARIQEQANQQMKAIEELVANLA